MFPGQLALTFYPGASNEVSVANGASEFTVLEVVTSHTTGSNAQKLEATILDETGAHWRAIKFGARVQCRINGQLLPTSYTVGPRNIIALAGGTGPVMLKLECVGRTSVLYTETVLEDALFMNKTPAWIAKDILDDVFSGTLDTSLIDVGLGVNQAQFEIGAGENVGDVLERLNAIDGFTFEVDEMDRVRYAPISVTSQATITDDDLDADPQESGISEGVQPPVSLLRIKGSTGYAATTRQETQDAYYDLNATSRVVAHRFKAESARLSGVDLYLNRTVDPNKPANLLMEIRTDNPAFDHTTAFSSTGGNETIGGSSEWLACTFLAFASGSCELRSLVVTYTWAGSPGTATLSIYATDGAGKPTGAALATSSAFTAGTPSSTTLTWSSINLTLTQGLRYAVVMKATNPLGGFDFWHWKQSSDSRGKGWKSTDSGSTWSATGSTSLAVSLTLRAPVPTSTKVEWSDDNQITAGDSPYPPSFATTKSWTKPKLALTKGAYYWLFLKDTAATGTKYWRVGYNSLTPSSDDQGSLVSTDSGSTWDPLGFDITHRLLWSQDPIDVIVTNARGKIDTGGMTDSQNTIPVKDLTDFATSGTATCESEDMTWTGKSAATGAGTLTGVTRGANGTTPASHAADKWVTAAAVRDYGVWPRTISNENIGSEAEARAVAAIIFQKLRAPARRMTLTLNRLRGELTPRSVITVKRPALDINGDFEITEVRHESPSGSIPRTTLVIGTLEYDGTRALEELRKGA